MAPRGEREISLTASLESQGANSSTTKAPLNVVGIIAVAAAMLNHLVLGTLYCWGSFQSYVPAHLKNYDGKYDPASGNKPDTVQILSLTILFEALSMPFGSMIADRLGPRPVSLLSGTIMATALVSASYCTSLRTFTVLYAGLLGTGVGLGYAAPMVNGFKHFPSKQGTIAGLIAGAFGCGGFFFNNLGRYIFNPKGLSVGTDKLMPAEVTDAFSANLRRLALIYVAVPLIAAPFIISPKEAAVTVRARVYSGCSIEPVEGQPYFTVASALRTRGFWIMWMAIALSSQGALYVGSAYKEIAHDLDNPDLKGDDYLVMVGALGALSNGLCRPVVGIMMDRIGFRNSFSLCASMHILLYFFFPLFTSSPLLYTAGVVLSFAGLAGYCALVPAEAFRAYGNGAVLGCAISAFAFAGVFGAKITDFVKNLVADESGFTPDTEALAFKWLSLMCLTGLGMVQFYGR